ncbi:MAG: hypothetical protein K8F91_09225 [Candidatus Obscuribacterales bacterium]|nr:hypothetical protein [Candidatus Obscuribacterales bacterium]
MFLANVRNSTFLLVSLLLLNSLSVCAKDGIPDRLFREKKAPAYPAYIEEPHSAAHGDLVPPPAENEYFPVREDGQAYMLNVDSTVNLTTALNRFYYDPKWRGEVWVPYDQVSAIERATRLMSTWKEYDEFSELRIFNKWHKFWERASGFGP